MAEIKTISILGCGWYGFALAEKLIKNGFTVKGSSTSNLKFESFEQAGIIPFEVKFDAESEEYPADFFECDLLIISIPPKRRLAETAFYPKKIERIKSAVETHGVKRVIFISSTGVYGDHNLTVTEDTPPNPTSDSGKAMLDAEEILKNHPHFSTTILRFAGLIGPKRDPVRFFAGKKDIPNGKAPVNLVPLDDCITVTLAVIKLHAFGYTFNVCSQMHPMKMDFYKQAALKSGLELPEFIDELKEWKIVSSNYVESVLGCVVESI